MNEQDLTQRLKSIIQDLQSLKDDIPDDGTEYWNDAHYFINNAILNLTDF